MRKGQPSGDEHVHDCCQQIDVSCLTRLLPPSQTVDESGFPLKGNCLTLGEHYADVIRTASFFQNSSLG